MAIIFSKIFLVFLVQYITAGSALDSVANYCRRVGHSSISKNGSIYISGGYQTFIQNGSSTITSGIMDALLQLDITQSWDATTNISFTQTPKMLNGTMDGYSRPLTVMGGGFFGGRQTQSSMWQFGGTTQAFNTSAPNFERAPDMTHALWMYDGTETLWSAVNTSAAQVVMPAYGAWAEAPSLSLGFYLGGGVNVGTADSVAVKENDSVRIGGMIVVDTDSGRLANLTIRDFVNSNRRGARMEYIPLYGEKGIIAMMGGRDLVDLVSMQEIAIFDVASLAFNDSSSTGPTRNTWYVQNATGDIPSPRRDFCLIHAPAPDNSSVSIYLYGGRADAVFYDDLYVLSLPSFTWVRLYSGSNSRWYHTCHRAGKRQMIVLGGAGAATDYNASCDSAPGGVRVVDMTDSTWGTVYNAFAPSYQLPDAVFGEIGGGAKGSATKQIPDMGFSSDDLAKLFSTTNNQSTNSGDDSETGGGAGHHLGAGVVAGIAISVAALVLASLAIVWYMLRRRHNIFRSLDDCKPPLYEAAGQEKVELSNDGQWRSELGVKQLRVELSTIPSKHGHASDIADLQQRMQRYGLAELG